MPELTANTTVCIVNPEGLHARPAYMFVELAGKFESRIDIVKDGERVDGKSILSILTLAAEQGTELFIEATGPDAQAALDALADLVLRGFPSGETTNTIQKQTLRKS